MKKFYLILAVLGLLVLAGCTTQTQTTEKEGIITSFYPVEEITRAIVQDTQSVQVVVAYGAEPHSYEPSARDLAEYSNAKVFVTMEGIFEHLEEEIIEANSHLIVVEAAHDLELIKGDEHDDDDDHSEEESHEEEDHDNHNDEEKEHHDHHGHGEYDPHVWLSIYNMEKMTQEVLEKLVEIYPENQAAYEANAQAFVEQLETLEEEYETTLASCTYDKAIVNHKAFGYLAHEYGFEQVSVAGFSPESEPSPATIQAVINEANEYGLQYVFSEGQLDSKVAETIANDIGGEVLELNPIKMSAEEDYFSLMRANLENLNKGLGCSN